MMSSIERHSKAAPDVLQLNMEIISKELNDLIVTGDQEFTLTQQFSVTTLKTATHSFVTSPALANNYQVPPTFISNAVYDQQQFCAAQGIPNLRFYQNNYQMLQQPVSFINPQYNAIKSNESNPSNILNNASKFANSSCLSSMQDSFSNVNASPTYEFHYLRSHAENDKKSFNSSMSSLNGQGAFRKFYKNNPKHTYQKLQNTHVNNDEIQFDLSTLTLDIDKESSNVRHLFQLLRDLHLSIAETPPNFDENSESQFEETFVSAANKKSSMPSTLNVQNQVKQACRKLTIFTYEMQRILSANKVFDGEMHAECEFYFNQLQQYLNQLEMYKRIVMEHKHGKFLREEVNAHAERLSLLLEHTNRQIREVHIRILAADWFIGVKYRGDIHLTAMQLNNTEVCKKSKIGVVNEILEMTSTAEAAFLKNNTTAKAQATEAIKPETASLSISPKQSLFNKKVANAKLFNKNNDIFNIYKPVHTKRSTAAATTAATGNHQHTRHPVFYIG